MFKKTACESVMNRLRCGMSLEVTDKSLVFYKIILQYLSQIRIIYFLMYPSSSSYIPSVLFSVVGM